jgi:tRNA 2-thiouridine synthesizing protein A
MADETLDASGLNCPLPILKTKKALSKMSALNSPIN